MSELDAIPVAADDPIDPKAQRESDAASLLKKLDEATNAAKAEIAAKLQDPQAVIPADLNGLDAVKSAVPDYFTQHQVLRENRDRASVLSNQASVVLKQFENGENPPVLPWDEFLAANGG